MKEEMEGWIARDKNNTLIFYSKKPHRLQKIGRWGVELGAGSREIKLESTMFPDLRWEDEPMYIEYVGLLLKEERK